jgi:hypothetical protein
MVEAELIFDPQGYEGGAGYAKGKARDVQQAEAGGLADGPESRADIATEHDGIFALFVFWLMGLLPIAPPHVDARDLSFVILCKLHVDILIEDEFVVGYRDQFEHGIAPLGISAVEARLVGIEDQSALECSRIWDKRSRVAGCR